MAIGRFLAGIFALVYSPGLDRYLILQRSEERDHAPGVWECVTGRVDQGEGFEDALHREAQEEIGVDIQFEFIAGTMHFYRGPKTPEYEMLGVLCACSLDDPESIRISSEHAQYRWVTLPEVAQMVVEQGIRVRFIQHAIQRVETLRKLTPPGLSDALRQAGMDLELS